MPYSSQICWSCGARRVSRDFFGEERRDPITCCDRCETQALNVSPVAIESGFVDGP